MTSEIQCPTLDDINFEDLIKSIPEGEYAMGNAGYVYAPYVPLMSTKTVLGGQLPWWKRLINWILRREVFHAGFKPKKAVMSRYAKKLDLNNYSSVKIGKTGGSKVLDLLQELQKYFGIIDHPVWPDYGDFFIEVVEVVVHLGYAKKENNMLVWRHSVERQ